MTATVQLDKDEVYDTRKVVYRKLDHGLNTNKAPHDLDRSELATLVNAWYAYGSALSKRPGSTSFIGALPDGGTTVSLVTCRFADVTYVVVQSSHNHVYAAATTALAWGAAIGTLQGGIMDAAQMYDPKTGKDTLFIVDGVDTPQMWQGPATVLTPVATGTPSAGLLPNKAGTASNVTNSITPSFVATLGNNSHLMYSGDKSAPSAVWISDAFFPESFTTPAMQADPYGYNGAGGTFLPAVIGMNDGVDGGDITGLQTLGFAMVVFKESAIYAMVQTQLLGAVAWQVYTVAAKRGALSPRSIIAFEGFIGFLSIDGVYVTYGQPNEQMNKQKISGNVPSYFDSTKFGEPALIANRKTAAAVRIANRYLVFFDTGSGQLTHGVWFDFDGTSENGLPTAGEIQGMTVGGLASADGPNDQGLFYWGDAGQSRVGQFGVGFQDFTTPITVQLGFKLDDFEMEFGPQALIMNKVPSRCDLVLAPLSNAASGSNLEFLGSIGVDSRVSYPPSIPLPAIATPAAGGTWGSSTWGSFSWTSAQIAEVGWSILTMRPQSGVRGKALQLGILEVSGSPWVLIGAVWELNAQQVTR